MAVIDLEIEELLKSRSETMREFTADHRHLNMYAIFRRDLDMPIGKIVAQCGHAYLNAYEKSLATRPLITSAYKGTGNGTKICMHAKNLNQLIRAYKEARQLGIPCDLVIDRDHVLAPNFDGSPVITALGIGPAFRDEVVEITKRLTVANFGKFEG